MIDCDDITKKKYWVSNHEGIPKETKVVFNGYLLSLKLENKTETTVSKYCSLLEKFFIDRNVSLEELTTEDVFTCLHEFSIDKKPRTIDLMLSSLSSMFNFFLEEGYMDAVVRKNRWRPKISQSLPQFLNEQEYALVKLVSEELSSRNRALVRFLFFFGLQKIRG